MSNIYLNLFQIAPIIFDKNIIQNIFLLILAWPKRNWYHSVLYIYYYSGINSSWHYRNAEILINTRICICLTIRTTNRCIASWTLQRGCLVGFELRRRSDRFCSLGFERIWRGYRDVQYFSYASVTVNFTVSTANWRMAKIFCSEDIYWACIVPEILPKFSPFQQSKHFDKSCHLSRKQAIHLSSVVK